MPCFFFSLNRLPLIFTSSIDKLEKGATKKISSNTSKKHHNESIEQEGEDIGAVRLRRCPYGRRQFKSFLLNVWYAVSKKGSLEPSIGTTTPSCMAIATACMAIATGGIYRPGFPNHFLYEARNHRGYSSSSISGSIILNQHEMMSKLTNHQSAVSSASSTPIEIIGFFRTIRMPQNVSTLRVLICLVEFIRHEI